MRTGEAAAPLRSRDWLASIFIGAVVLSTVYVLRSGSLLTQWNAPKNYLAPALVSEGDPVVVIISLHAQHSHAFVLSTIAPKYPSVDA